MIDDFSLWLRRYLKHQSSKYRSTAHLLINEINHVKTIAELYTLLDREQIPDRYTFFYTSTPDIFIEKRNEFIRTIESRQRLHLEVLSNFTNLSIPLQKKELIDLIDLLIEVLAHSLNLLHHRALGLLNSLNVHEELQNIINHLAQQCSVPRPNHPTPGSFNACTPLNDKHASCLNLLRNNSATYDVSNPNSTKTNHLLQNLLIIYKDIHTLSVELGPEDQDDEQESCSLTGCFQTIFKVGSFGSYL